MPSAAQTGWSVTANSTAWRPRGGRRPAYSAMASAAPPSSIAASSARIRITVSSVTAPRRPRGTTSVVDHTISIPASSGISAARNGSVGAR